jgi:hypothetical protein
VFCVSCLWAVPCSFVCAASAFCLIRAVVVDGSKAVDLFNSATGAWSTAQLSVGRNTLAATSLGTVAIFAGGEDASGSVLVIL